MKKVVKKVALPKGMGKLTKTGTNKKRSEGTSRSETGMPKKTYRNKIKDTGTPKTPKRRTRMK